MILLGISNSGYLHFGNYLSIIKPIINFKKKIFLIADLHGKCKNLNYLNLIKNKIIFISIYVSFFKKIYFYQSYNNIFLNFFWLLLCLFKKKKINNFHSYKKYKNISIAQYCYPLLMVSDIYSINNKYIFVGIDQIQHIELYKKIIKKINFIIGKKIFFLNKFIINNKILYSYDKKKMSKTNKNELFIFSNFLEILFFLKKFKKTKKIKKSLLSFCYNIIGNIFVKKIFFNNNNKIFIIKTTEIIYFNFLLYKKKFLNKLKYYENFIKKINLNNNYMNNIIFNNIYNLNKNISL
ncbi:MAG: hypothetical protein ACH6QQ_00260 [Candidatus Carsonella ruddii]